MNTCGWSTSSNRESRAICWEMPFFTASSTVDFGANTGSYKLVLDGVGSCFSI